MTGPWSEEADFIRSLTHKLQPSRSLYGPPPSLRSAIIPPYIVEWLTCCALTRLLPGISKVLIRKTVETYLGLCSLCRNYSFIGSPLIYRSHRWVINLYRLVVGCHRCCISTPFYWKCSFTSSWGAHSTTTFTMNYFVSITVVISHESLSHTWARNKYCISWELNLESHEEAYIRNSTCNITVSLFKQL